MKKIILLMLLIFSTLAASSQDIFTTTEFTDNGREFHKLTYPKIFVINKISEDRTEFKVLQGSLLVLDGYLTKCEVVKSEETLDYLIESRRIVVINKNNGTTEYIFLFTTVVDKTNNKISKYIISVIEDKIVKRAYKGSN